jgi:hypothetical protein
MSPVTLSATITALHDIAVVQGKTTSTARLKLLAEFCRQELASRGLEGAEIEAEIAGGGRSKEWDVAWKHDGKYRLAISLKSILRNLAGTVPNRIDDLIGETANIQMYSPEVVVGYLMVFNVAEDAAAGKHGGTWCDVLQRRLKNLSGRRAPHWSVETIESFAVLRVDFSKGPALLSGEEEVGILLDSLVTEVRKRNPGIRQSGART